MIRVTPAAAASARTASRSSRNSAAERWAWASTSPEDTGLPRQRRRLLYQAPDLVEPFLPEGGVAEVHAQAGEEGLGGVRAAGLQEGEVAGDEGRPLLPVHPVERQDQELPEHVGVAVETGVDEVRDIGPAPA